MAAQVEALEELFDESMDPPWWKRSQLAESIGLTRKQVYVWFHRRRQQEQRQRSGAISSGSGSGENSSRFESSSSDTCGVMSRPERRSHAYGEKSRSESPSSDGGENSRFESPSMDSVMTAMKGLQSSVENIMDKQNELMRRQMTFELEFHSFALRMETQIATQIADLRSNIRQRRR